MINESDIERYFKVNRFKYALGYRYRKYISGNSFKIVDNSNNIVLHVYNDRDTEKLFTVLSIKYQRNTLNIFRIKGFNK